MSFNDSEVYPFEEIPSGVDLARYFWHETNHVNPGYDGINLWRDGSQYCYLWVTASVDFDMDMYYLLDVRTKTDGDEMRDGLFLHLGSFDTFEVEWQQKPYAFGTATIENVYASLQWFYDKIKETE